MFAILISDKDVGSLVVKPLMSEFEIYTTYSNRNESIEVKLVISIKCNLYFIDIDEDYWKRMAGRESAAACIFIVRSAARFNGGIIDKEIINSALEEYFN